MATATAPIAPAASTTKEWWKVPGATEPIGTVATAAPAAVSTPAQWNVSADQTVQGQVKDVIDANGPLMQQADTRSKQQMNKLGLMNSSMALSAGQAALYDAALPIAQQDAQTKAQSASVNTAATNRASEFNAGNIQQVNLANANAENAATADSNKIRAQAATLDADAANKMLMADLDNQFKTAITNADSATKIELQKLSDATKTNLVNIEADYKTLIQTSASAGDIYKSTISSVSQIIQDTNMDAASKTAAINGLFSRMGVAMNLIGSINGVDVTDLLNFGTVA